MKHRGWDRGVPVSIRAPTPPKGLEAVLVLRSVHMSDRLPRFWANFARGYRKEVNLCA